MTPKQAKKLQQQKLAIARAKANAKQKGLPDPFPNLDDNGNPTPEYQKKLDEYNDLIKPNKPVSKEVKVSGLKKLKKGNVGNLTPEIQEEICKYIAQCQSERTASILAGINYETYKQWTKKGRAAKFGKYYNLVQAINKARESGLSDIVNNIRIASISDWRAGLAILRRYDDEWADKQILGGKIKTEGTMEHSGEVTLTESEVENRLRKKLGKLGIDIDEI